MTIHERSLKLIVYGDSKPKYTNFWVNESPSLMTTNELYNSGLCSNTQDMKLIIKSKSKKAQKLRQEKEL